MYFCGYTFVVAKNKIRFSVFQILLRLSKLCIQEGSSGKKSRKQQQRLLRNMGAHSVVLELLQIPYEKVQVVFEMNKALQSFFSYLFT